MARASSSHEILMTSGSEDQLSGREREEERVGTGRVRVWFERVRVRVLVALRWCWQRRMAAARRSVTTKKEPTAAAMAW